MKSKGFKVITVVILGGAFIIILLSFLKNINKNGKYSWDTVFDTFRTEKAQDFQSNAPNNNSNAPDNNSNAPDNNSNQVTLENYNGIGEYYNSEVYEMNETVITDGLSYRVNSVKTLKEEIDFPKSDDLHKEAYDAEGNLLENYYYIVIDITIGYQGNDIKEISLNSIWLGTFDSEDNNILEHELCAYNDIENVNMKSYFIKEMQNEKELTVSLVYIVTDNEIRDNNLAILINNDGIGHSDNRRCIRVAF